MIISAIMKGGGMVHTWKCRAHGWDISERWEMYLKESMTVFVVALRLAEFDMDMMEDALSICVEFVTCRGA
jgi:hypothetical protein